MPAERTAHARLKQTTLADFGRVEVPKSTHAKVIASDTSEPRPARSTPSPLVSKAKAKVKAKAGDEDRVLTDVVLSIKPEFTKLISERKKNHEYRKYKLKESVDRLWLYETAPTSAITTGPGERPVVRYISTLPLRPVLSSDRYDDAPEGSLCMSVPGEVNDPSGIGNDDFDKGLKQSKYGYPVTGLYRLKKPLTTSELKQRFDIAVPQGWRYATKRLVEEVRLEDMDKLF
ncbi:hypothetical protein BN946_scf184985.g10 [Trametes cinnabarina]|uniref:Uncharacterized protein n=1 Tax=Pycnoporus cinnabarinus TaxID=5643 RepID=A0A060SED7_PYCCI|nr:hypothetical protein BN946_scf184985.g10 [Trametes cinnabarina]